MDKFVIRGRYIQSGEYKYLAYDAPSGGYPYMSKYFSQAALLDEETAQTEILQFKPGSTLYPLEEYDELEIFLIELLPFLNYKEAKRQADRADATRQSALAKLTEEEKKLLGLA